MKFLGFLDNHSILYHSTEVETSVLSGLEGQWRAFDWGELSKATNGFHESTIVGEGAFGRVYRGQLSNGLVVAIKQLKKMEVGTAGRSITYGLKADRSGQQSRSVEDTYARFNGHVSTVWYIGLEGRRFAIVSHSHSGSSKQLRCALLHWLSSEAEHIHTVGFSGMHCTREPVIVSLGTAGDSIFPIRV
jgi:hypothetical protein